MFVSLVDPETNTRMLTAPFDHLVPLSLRPSLTLSHRRHQPQQRGRRRWRPGRAAGGDCVLASAAEGGGGAGGDETVVGGNGVLARGPPSMVRLRRAGTDQARNTAS